jgi:hypothetical protein
MPNPWLGVQAPPHALPGPWAEPSLLERTQPAHQQYTPGARPARRGRSKSDGMMADFSSLYEQTI